MGNMCSSGSETNDVDAKKKSQAIDRGLDEDQRKFRRECKILLLGMASSQYVVAYAILTQYLHRFR
jgi:guanine nucleotide-binding protein G(i) subunit alpha